MVNVHLWTRTRNEVVITSPWTRWSAWSGKTPIFGIRARVRTRTVTTTWQEKGIHSTCGLCQNLEGEYIWGIGGFTTPWRNKKTVVVEEQTQYRYFDPPDALPQWKCQIAPPIFPQDLVRFESGWVKNVDGVQSYEARLDLEPHDGRTFVKGADLGIGHHAFEIKAKLKGKSKGVSASSHQLHFDVLSPIEMAFVEPEISVDLRQVYKHRKSKKPFENGRRVKLKITNNTNQSVCVFLRPCSIPRGWHVIAFEGVITLKAHDSKKVYVQIEMMDQAAVPKEPRIPVAIEGQILGRAPFGFTTAATCYVRPDVKDSYRKQSIALHKKRVRRGLP